MVCSIINKSKDNGRVYFLPTVGVDKGSCIILDILNFLSNVLIITYLKRDNRGIIKGLKAI